MKIENAKVVTFETNWEFLGALGCVIAFVAAAVGGGAALGYAMGETPQRAQTRVLLDIQRGAETESLNCVALLNGNTAIQYVVKPIDALYLRVDCSDLFGDGFEG